MQIIVPQDVVLKDLSMAYPHPEEEIPQYDHHNVYAAGSKCYDFIGGEPYVFVWSPPDSVPGHGTLEKSWYPHEHYVTSPSEIIWNVEEKWWLRIGKLIDEFAMFDQAVETQTVSNGAITLQFFSAEKITGIALINLTGVKKIKVVVSTEAEGEVYRREEDLIYRSGITNFYQWFFAPLKTKSELVLTDLPPYLDVNITVEISGDEQDVDAPLAVGECICGEAVYLGALRYGASSEYKKWKYRVLGAEGELIEKMVVKQTTSYDINVKTRRLGYVKRILQTLEDIPTVFIGSEKNETTIVYGVFEKFNLVLDGYTVSRCNLIVEERLPEGEKNG